MSLNIILCTIFLDKCRSIKKDVFYSTKDVFPLGEITGDFAAKLRRNYIARNYNYNINNFKR